MGIKEEYLKRLEKQKHLTKKTAEEIAEEGGLFKLSEDQRYILNLIKASAERTVKMLWVAILVLIMALCASNACWIYYEADVKPMLIEKAIEDQFDIDPDSVNIYYK